MNTGRPFASLIASTFSSGWPTTSVFSVVTIWPISTSGLVRTASGGAGDSGMKWSGLFTIGLSGITPVSMGGTCSPRKIAAERIIACSGLLYPVQRHKTPPSAWRSASPSTVTIERPSACPARSTHVGVNLLSIRTEHAPHSPVSQPCFTLQIRSRRNTSIRDNCGSQ